MWTQLLTGAPDDVKEYYGLYAPENYSYLAGSKYYTVDGVDDNAEFEVRVDMCAMKMRKGIRCCLGLRWLANIPATFS